MLYTLTRCEFLMIFFPKISTSALNVALQLSFWGLRGASGRLLGVSGKLWERPGSLWKPLGAFWGLRERPGGFREHQEAFGENLFFFTFLENFHF